MEFDDIGYRSGRNFHGSNDNSYSGDKPFDQDNMVYSNRHSNRLQATTVGFQGYIVPTVDPFPGFHHVVVAYCIMAFLLMYPFVVCGRHIREERRRRQVEKEVKGVEGGQHRDTNNNNGLVSPGGSEIMQSFAGGPKVASTIDKGEGPPPRPSTTVCMTLPPTQLPNNNKMEGSVCSAPPQEQRREEEPTLVTPTTTKSTLNDEDDAGKPMSQAVPGPPMGIEPPDLTRHHHHHHPNLHDDSASTRQQQASQVASSGLVSRNLSAATTGRLYSSGAFVGRRTTTAAWPRHRHARRPSGDPSFQWRRAIQLERRHSNRRLERLYFGAGGSSQASSSGFAGMRKKHHASGMMSDLAGRVLDAETYDQYHHNHQQHKVGTRIGGDSASNSKYAPTGTEFAQFSRKGMAMRQRPPNHGSGRVARRPSHTGSARSGSLRSGYQSSVMSSIVDDISPNDAADADDPGKVRIFPGPMEGSQTHGASACCSVMEPWLDAAEPGDECKRLMSLALPMTLGSLLEPLSKCIVVGILSHLVGTHAMVAYLLVQLLYRLTAETLSVAITDAESSLVQLALTSAPGPNQGSGNTASTAREGYKIAGQYIQLAFLMQLLVVGAVLILWRFYVEDVILWWVDSPEMASLAQDYYEIVLWLFLVQSLYRAIGVPFHMRGPQHSSFETYMDVFVCTATLITIGVVLSQTTDIPGEHERHTIDEERYTPQDRLDDSRTALVNVAWIQVNIGIAACVLKVAFCVAKGWLDHFWAGLIRSFAILNFGAFCNLFLTSIPLVVGAFLEMGEVELLTLFVQFLGPAEVASWAVLGTIWTFLEASTQGISEAAATRVAYHLSASQPSLAKKVAHKALFWTVVGSLILTSILLLAGRHIIVGLTVDYTMQHLLDDMLGLLGLANLSMAFAQVCWSLVGAQGRFNLATLVVLVCRWLLTMPLSFVFIFALQYDEESLVGAFAVGSATSASILASILFSSDWNEVAQALFMQGLLSCEDDDDFDFSFGDDVEDSDDDESAGFGSGYPSNKKSLDNDEPVELQQTTDPTTRTGTNTSSNVNSGGGSGVNGIGESGVEFSGPISGLSES